MVRYVSRKGSQISEGPLEVSERVSMRTARVRDAAPPLSSLADGPSFENPEFRTAGIALKNEGFRERRTEHAAS
jgi:hypothetical protein